MIEGLFTTLTNVSFDDDAIRAQIEKTHREKEKLLAAPVRRKAEEKLRQQERILRLEMKAENRQPMITISVSYGTWIRISVP